MPRVAWVFDGYSWPINPKDDTGWINEHVNTELNNINASVSTFQFGGMKSDRRRISGFIWGPSSGVQYITMYNWAKTKKIATLIDHLGNSRPCFFLTFTPKLLPDAVAWKQGWQTYTYDAELVATT